MTFSVLSSDIMILIVVLNHEIRDLESYLPYFQTEASAWHVTNLLQNNSTSQCSSTWLLGGYDVTNYGESYTRVYPSVPSHSAIFFSIEVWLLDLHSAGDAFRLLFDGQVVDTWSPNSSSGLLSGGGTCSETGISYKTTLIRGVAMHSATSLMVNIQSLSSSSYPFSLGLRSVNLLFAISSTHSSTLGCDYSSTFLSTTSCMCAENEYPSYLGCLSCNSLCGSCISSLVTDCTSCIDGASYNGNACFTCSSSCDQCTGTTSNDCIRCPVGSYLYKNGTCLSDCSSPFIIITEGEYASCITPCNSPYPFLYSNGTCTANCSYPYVQVNTSDGFYCDFSCEAGDYLYWNGSCEASCPAPLINSTYESNYFCNLPCTANEFYYANGTCMSNCSYPYTNTTENNIQFCDLICGTSDYLYWNNSCHSTCPNPLVNTTWQLAHFCNPPCTNNEFYYPNATCLPNCSYPYVNTTQNDLKICSSRCGTSDYLYWNGSCIPSCLSPLVNFTQENTHFCILPCPSNQFYYNNGSCQTTCHPPFIQRLQGDLQLCDQPCASEQYLNYNGSCVDFCPSSFQATNSSVPICLFHCSPGMYLYWNSTCQTSCDHPLTTINIPYPYPSCRKPCQSGYYLYPNGSCLAYCNYTRQLSVDGVYSCVYPCNVTQFWYPNSQVCQSSCLSPYATIVIDAYLTKCVPPCPVNKYYDEITSTCLDHCDSGITIRFSSDINICRPNENCTETPGVVAIMATAASYLASANIFRPTSSHSVFMISFTKLLKYIKFIKVKIPEQYMTLLDSNASSIFSVSTAFGYSMPSDLPDRLPDHELPLVFQNAGYHSSYLINFWDAMSTYSIVIALGTFFYLLEKLAIKFSSKDNSIPALVLQRIRILTHWNFLLILMFNTYDDMTLFALFEYQTLYLASKLELVSCAVCTIITLIGLYFLIMIYIIAIKSTHRMAITAPVDHVSKECQQQMHFGERWSSYQALYSGYKNDSLLKQICLFIQTVRIISYYIIVVILYNNPFVQVILLSIISLLMILYFIKEKPFKSDFNLTVTLIFELLVLLVNVCLTALVVLDLYGNLTSGSQNLLSEIIIICNSMIDMLGNILTWLYILLGAWSIYHETRSCGLRGKLVWMNLALAMYEGPGVDLDNEPYVQSRTKIRSSTIDVIRNSFMQQSEISGAKNKAILYHEDEDGVGKRRKPKFERRCTTNFQEDLYPKSTARKYEEDANNNEDSIRFTRRSGHQKNDSADNNTSKERKTPLNSSQDLTCSSSSRTISFNPSSSRRNLKDRSYLIKQQCGSSTPRSPYSIGGYSSSRLVIASQLPSKDKADFTRTEGVQRRPQKSQGINKSIYSRKESISPTMTINQSYSNNIFGIRSDNIQSLNFGAPRSITEFSIYDNIVSNHMIIRESPELSSGSNISKKLGRRKIAKQF